MASEKSRVASEGHRLREDVRKVVHETFVKATHDPLTNLPNRWLFHDRLSVAVSDTRRYREVAALLFLDIDRFKEINDRYGHPVGDEVLKRVAAMLSRNVRLGDTVARYGGDEFVVLVRHLQTRQELDRVVRRLLVGLEKTIAVEDKSFVVTASIGVSLAPFDGLTEADLIRKSDEASLRVKKLGGGGFDLYAVPSEWYPAEKEEPMDAQKQKTILIVEDDEDSRTVLSKRLASAGYRCVGCRSVEEALKSLQSGLHPDLTILDLAFRFASGIAFLQNRGRYLAGGASSSPVLIVSGHGNDDVREVTEALGACDFIPKPVDSEKLISKIRTLIH